MMSIPGYPKKISDFVRETLLTSGLFVLVVAAVGLTKAQTPTQTPTQRPTQSPLRKQGVVLNGIVVDSDDKPITGAVVSTRARFTEPVVTDENGRFQIAFSQQLNPDIITWATLPGTDLIAIRRLPRIAERSGEISETKIVLQKGRRFFGKVVDEAGQPVAEAYVGASAWTWTIEPVLTDKQGNFEFYFSQGQTHDVFAFKPGIGFDCLSVETKDQDTIASTLEPEKGPLTLTLTKTDPIALHIGDENGNPLEGVDVGPTFIVKTDGAGSNFSLNADSRMAHDLQLFSVTTDDNGNAVIDWFPKEAGSEFYTYDRQNRYGSIRIPWRLGTTLSARLPKRTCVEGSVRLADGTPVPWASLAHKYGRGNGWRYADGEGNFSYPLNSHEKVSIVVESNLGAAPAAFAIDVGDGSNPPRVDFVLEKGTRFYGEVLAGPDKRPYPTNVSVGELALGPSLPALPSDASPEERDKFMELLSHQSIARTVRVDENGNFETRLPPGKYTARTWLPKVDNLSRQSEPVKFEIIDEAEKRLDFHVPYFTCP